MSKNDRFVADSCYWIGFTGITCSILITFMETLTQGRPVTNTGASFTFWDGTFWDKQEAMFVIIGVASFLFLLFAFRFIKTERFWLEATAYCAVILGSPDIFRSYNGFIWGMAREDQEYYFCLLATAFLVANLMLYRRAVR